MTTLSDSLTVAILLFLVFGALGFYLYSRLTQNEKRVGLLENLLLSLKMSTEASLQGPDMLGPDSVEPVSSPAPLGEGDVDAVEEEKYADLLKEMPMASSSPAGMDAVADENDAASLLRSMNLGEKSSSRKMDANYESMSVKELQALVKQRGLVAGGEKRKKDLIDALRKQASPSSDAEVSAGAAAAVPAEATTLVEFDGAESGAEGIVLAH